MLCGWSREAQDAEVGGMGHCCLLSTVSGRRSRFVGQDRSGEEARVIPLRQTAKRQFHALRNRTGPFTQAQVGVGRGSCLPNPFPLAWPPVNHSGQRLISIPQDGISRRSQMMPIYPWPSAKFWPWALPPSQGRESTEEGKWWKPKCPSPATTLSTSLSWIQLPWAPRSNHRRKLGLRISELGFLLECLFWFYSLRTLWMGTLPFIPLQAQEGPIPIGNNLEKQINKYGDARRKTEL